MSNEYWKNCPYYENGNCPQSESIDAAYLIPQLLDPADIDSIKQTCKTCGKYLDQKRKYPRIKRPLQIVLITEHQKAIKGNIVDLSEGGALIQLQKWADFKKDEKVLLEIYPSHPTLDKSSHELTKVSGLIKRIEPESKQLVMVFLQRIREVTSSAAELPSSFQSAQKNTEIS
jgi:hypothetical protein